MYISFWTLLYDFSHAPFFMRSERRLRQNGDPYIPLQYCVDSYVLNTDTGKAAAGWWLGGGRGGESFDSSVLRGLARHRPSPIPSLLPAAHRDSHGRPSPAPQARSPDTATPTATRPPATTTPSPAARPSGPGGAIPRRCAPPRERLGGRVRSRGKRNHPPHGEMGARVRARCIRFLVSIGV